MILNFKTGRLPLNFFFLGAMLFIIGAWRMIVLDWKGIILFVISLLCLFIKSGVIIDTVQSRMKKYIGFLTIRKGDWEDIKSLINLEIIETKETHSMSVLTISRTETDDVYKLFMVMPDKRIELMSGKKDLIFNRAKKIASLLQTTVING